MRAGSNPPEYYLTLSPASRQYTADGGRPLAMPFWGADKSVPEYVRAPTEAHDPFRADVYALGNLIRRDFLEVRVSVSLFFRRHGGVGVSTVLISSRTHRSIRTWDSWTALSRK